MRYFFFGILSILFAYAISQIQFNFYFYVSVPQFQVEPFYPEGAHIEVEEEEI